MVIRLVRPVGIGLVTLWLATLNAAERWHGRRTRAWNAEHKSCITTRRTK